MLMDYCPTCNQPLTARSDGGKARAVRLSPERRREIAVKASRAAAEVRMKRTDEEEILITDLMAANHWSRSEALSALGFIK